MSGALSSLFAREQRAFLGRDRRGWEDHLARIRVFLGEGLERAGGPALILGAGSGLEVPWRCAPRGSAGWDADPLSRLGTLVRHRRWAPWVREDITGALEPLRLAAVRAARESWSGRRRKTTIARTRLAALLPGLPTEPLALRRRLTERPPAVLLAANFMGQLLPLAQRVVERAFAPESPWEPDPDEPDALALALEHWAARVIRALLNTMDASGTELWLVHDRAVLGPEPGLQLGAFTPEWRSQLSGVPRLEAWDPLCGVDVVGHFSHRPLHRGRRWLWQVAPDQLHLMEALAVGPR